MTSKGPARGARTAAGGVDRPWKRSPSSRRKPRAPTRAILWAAAIVAVPFFVGLIFIAQAGGGGEGTPGITVPVKQGPFRVVITEGGELESSRTVGVQSRVEGFQPKIIELLPEGSPVKKDDTVLVLDSADIQRALAEQEIAVMQTDAKAKASKEELEIQKNKAESLVAQSALALKLAKLDEVKYTQGLYRIEVDDLKGLIALAETELQDAEAVVEYYRKLVKKGFRTPEQLRGKEQALERFKYNLNRDREKLRVLEQFTRERNEVELKAKAEEAGRELARVKRSTVAEKVKATADHDAAEATAKIEKAQLDRLRRQLEECTVRAPAEGVVVYAREANNRVQLGAMVHYQQKLFSLPDLRDLQVKVYIHESVVKKVVPGLAAEIRIEAYPGKVLQGTVESVATFFDSVRYWTLGGVKEYTSIVRIHDVPDAGLKPGMTSEVRILVREIEDALLVPLQAVAEVGGSHVVYVPAAGGAERRDVEIGESDGRQVEIKQGVEAGERVFLDAASRAAAESPPGPGDERGG